MNREDWSELQRKITEDKVLEKVIQVLDYIITTFAILGFTLKMFLLSYAVYGALYLISMINYCIVNHTMNTTYFKFPAYFELLRTVFWGA